MTEAKRKRTLSKDGSVHVTDEVYNTLLSSLGAVLALIGSVFLIYRAHAGNDFWGMVSFSIYGFGIVSIFTTSALHHGVDGTPKTDHFLRQLDYFAIFLAIAGTFTPFCLLLLRNSLGWTVLGLVWALAIVGITIRALWPHLPRWVMLVLYFGMGWLGLLIAEPVYPAIQGYGFFALLLGGFFFTAGGLIYGLEKPNPLPGKFGFHEIWHCFVIAGVASHFYIMVRCF